MTATNGAGAAGAASASEKSRARPSDGRTPEVRAHMYALAAHVAEGGTFPAFTAKHGFDKSRVYQLWRYICADLGPQAAPPEKRVKPAPAAKREPSAPWCPPEYRKLNSKMASSGFSLAERQRIVADDIAKKAAA